MRYTTLHDSRFVALREPISQRVSCRKRDTMRPWGFQLAALVVAASAENGIIHTHTCPNNPDSTAFYHIIGSLIGGNEDLEGLPDLGHGDRINRVIRVSSSLLPARFLSATRSSRSPRDTSWSSPPVWACYRLLPAFGRL